MSNASVSGVQGTTFFHRLTIFFLFKMSDINEFLLQYLWPFVQGKINKIKFYHSHELQPTCGR